MKLILSCCYSQTLAPTLALFSTFHSPLATFVRLAMRLPCRPPSTHKMRKNKEEEEREKTREEERKKYNKYHHNKIQFFPPLCACRCTCCCYCWRRFPGAARNFLIASKMRRERPPKHFEICDASFVPQSVCECASTATF